MLAVAHQLTAPLLVRVLTAVACISRQAKKVRGIQAAFKLFNRIMRVPGRGELTLVELRVRPVPYFNCRV